MAQEVNIEKTVFERQQYRQVIKPTFNELTVGNQPAGQGAAEAPVPTVDEFFQYYQDLFFTIPKEGETNSHQYLINQSSEYTQGQAVNAEIQALTQEITNLRQENLDLQQQLLTLSNTTNA